MKHPRMHSSERVKATAQALDGGINLSTAPSLIGDDQLAECENMRWQNGALRTRRGFVTSSDRVGAFAADLPSQFFVDRLSYTVAINHSDGETTGFIEVAIFDPHGVPTGDSRVLDTALDTPAFVTDAYGSAADAYTCLLFTGAGMVYGIHTQYGVFEPLESQVYVPLYRINGTPTKTPSSEPTGDRVESENLLTPDIRMQYTADGVGIYYPTPGCYDIHSVTVGNNTYRMGATNGGVTVRFNRDGGYVWLENNGSPFAVAAGGHNNVTIRAGYGADTEMRGRRRLCRGIAYGGDGGGARLFVANHGYLLWSAPGNPLYFPATQYAAVGNPTDPITAFAKQGDDLVVFKQNAIYAVQYVRDDTVSVESIQTGSQTDVNATALIAVTPLHDEIGCDLPNTVALFDNRLMWACSDGRLYRLDTINRLQQRCVRTVGRQIRSALSSHPETAYAVATDDAYVLLWNDRVWIADDEDGLRWFGWSFDTNTTAVCLCRVDRQLRIGGRCSTPVGTYLFWFSQEGRADTWVTLVGQAAYDAVFAFENRPVVGRMCTKQFSFGDDESRKQLTRLYADVSADGMVEACYVTEHGQQWELPRRPCDGLRLTPAVSRCRRFALRLAGQGLSVGSLTLHVTLWR